MQTKQSAILILLLITSAKLHAYSSLTLQYGNNFKDQTQQFINASFFIEQLGYLDIGMGRSDYAITPTRALNLDNIRTDYFNLAYTSPDDTAFSFGLAYDIWEMNNFQADSYMADLWYQTGNWRIGLHPEQHKITFELNNRRSLGYRNTGGGISMSYFANNNLFLYGDHYRYQFSAPEVLQRRQTLPLRLEIALQLVNNQVSSKFDDSRSTLGADYYFENLSIGIEQQQITTAIDGSEYEITTASSSLLIGEHWQMGLSISRTKGISDNFYNMSLSYSW